MKKAILVKFVTTVRIIIDGDEPTDKDMERAFIKASEAFNDNNLEGLDSIEDDIECPFSEYDLVIN